MRVDFFDLFAKAGRLKPLAYGDHHLARRAGISASCVVKRGAVVHLVKNKFVDFFRFCCDDGECLAHIEVFNDIVKQEHLREESEDREQTRLYAVNEEGRKSNDNIRDEQRLPDIEIGIFLQNQSNDIRAAARRIAVEENRRPEPGKKHGEYHLEERLIRQRFRKWEEPFEQLVDKRDHQGAEDCFDPASATEKENAENQKCNVQYGHVGGLRKDGYQFGKQNGNAADAAEREAVRRLEKVNAGGNDDVSEAEKHPITNDGKRVFLLNFFAHI